MIPQKVLDSIVGRIVDAVKPQRILLFGSTARNEMRLNSDLDVLVVMPAGANRRETIATVHRSLRRFGYPVDVVVGTEHDLLVHGHDPGLVSHRALKEGKELYPTLSRRDPRTRESSACSLSQRLDNERSHNTHTQRNDCWKCSGRPSAKNWKKNGVWAITP